MKYQISDQLITDIPRTQVYIENTVSLPALQLLIPGLLPGILEITLAANAERTANLNLRQTPGSDFFQLKEACTEDNRY